MSATLGVEVTGSRPERVPGDLLIAPFFAGERPLRGVAGRIDWRLCGLLSQRLAEGRLEGAEGDAVLVAGPRSLRARRALLLGLGGRSGFGPEDLARLSKEAIRRATDLGAGVVALALPDTGGSGLVAERRTQAAVRGAAAALADASVSLRLVLVVVPGEVHATARALAELASRPGSTAVPLRSSSERRSAGQAEARPAGTPGAPLRRAPNPS